MEAINDKANAERQPFETKLNHDFEVRNDSLGCGAFGEVYKLRRKSDDKYFAIKIIRNFKKNHARKIRREAESLGDLDHHNVVRYYDSWTEKADLPLEEYKKIVCRSKELNLEVIKNSESGYLAPYDTFTSDSDYESDGDKNIDAGKSNSDSLVLFKNTSRSESSENETNNGVYMKTIYYLYIQMQLCDKTLRNLIDNDFYSDQDNLNKHFKEICDGLSHIHDNGIVHRDLKPENIFVSKNTIKIGDFGLSRKIAISESDDQGVMTDLTGYCGTRFYMAPEILNGKRQYTLKVDLYSLGMILLEMINKPMTCHEKNEILESILSKKGIPVKYLHCAGFRPIVRSLTHRNSQKRPDSSELLKLINSLHCKLEDTLREIADSKGNKEKYIAELESSVHLKIHTMLLDAIEMFHLYGGIYVATENVNSMAEKIPAEIEEILPLSHDSRALFAKYVVKNDIHYLRRYSTDEVLIYNTNCHLAKEFRECSFDIVASTVEKYINDVEIIQICFEFLAKLKFCSTENVHLYLSHRYLFEAVICEFDILIKNRNSFCNILTAAASNLLPPEELKFRLESLGLKEDVLQKIVTLYSPKPSKEFSINSLDLKDKLLQTANMELGQLLGYLKKFEIDLDKIFIAPLLPPGRIYSGLIFQAIVKDKINKWHCIASGGRYNKYINICDRTGVGISFNIRSILIAMESRSLRSRDLCAILSTSDENSLEMLSLLRKNHIQSFTTKHSDCCGNCRIIIKVLSEKFVKVYEHDDTIGWHREIYSGLYTERDFISHIKRSFEELGFEK